MNPRHAAALLGAILLWPGCGSTTKAPASDPTPDVAERAERPRFSSDARRVAFHAGAEGARRIFVMNADGSDLRRVTSGRGDHRDPAWGPDGRRLVYASNEGGEGYALYVLDVDAADPTRERVTDLPGDALQPTVSPLRYGLYAVAPDGCSADDALGVQTDGYEKVVFTRVYDGREEIWSASLAPVDVESVRTGWNRLKETSAHGSHAARLSPPEQRCSEPAFSLDGLSLAWTCDQDGPVIFDAGARWDHRFADALAALGPDPELLPRCDGYGEFDEAACFAALPRRYTRYEGEPVSAAADGIRRPSYSANQISIVGDADGRPVIRPRFGDDARWAPLSVPAPARDLTWRPDGAGVAYTEVSSGTVGFADTDLYLQTVRNLHEFPELFGAGESERLQRNRFVARPGVEREFYALYEKLRYRRRPQFVTADAVLQVFRDELQRILQAAEMRAAEDLRALSRALMDHYLARHARTGSATDRYYAAYFATAWVPLEAAASLELPDWEDYMDRHHAPDDEQLAARMSELTRPFAERLPPRARQIAAGVPAAIRGQVTRHLDAMLAHGGVGDLPVPSRPRPARIDWSQFRVRGSYAEGPLAGYFLAVSWYGQAPLPFDASLAELSVALEKVNVGDATAHAVWSRIDAVVGAFMGKPVDATLAHLAQVRRETPKLFAPFDAPGLQARLSELRGPIPLRDAEALEQGADGRALQVTFMPKRMGLDTTFFARLTHPRVPNRGTPTSLDVMAVFGSARAREHALAAVATTAHADAYRAVLDELTASEPHPARTPEYFATDVYHSWLAALIALAQASDVPADSLLTFARTEAWHDRRLYSALAGYAQLKHSAVLYNMQDMSAECGDSPSYYVAVEQPILSRPRGFVDPAPALFDAVAELAELTYRTLHGDPKGPSAELHVYVDDEDDQRLNAATLARELAAVARAQLAGEPLDDRQAKRIEYIGARLEAMTLQTSSTANSFSVGGERRGEHGIVLVTDVHTNLMRQEVVALGVGRIADLYVVVPDGVGERMTQGGIFTFYEFTQPMSARPTDEQWAERIGRGDLPPRPAWTDSFFEDAP